MDENMDGNISDVSSDVSSEYLPTTTKDEEMNERREHRNKSKENGNEKDDEPVRTTTTQEAKPTTQDAEKTGKQVRTYANLTNKNIARDNLSLQQYRTAFVTVESDPTLGLNPQNSRDVQLRLIAEGIGTSRLVTLYYKNRISNKLEIIFKTQNDMKNALSENLKMKKTGKPILIEALVQTSLLVTLECDYGVADDDITTEIEKHGKIISYKRACYTWAPEVESGKRIVKVIPSKSILTFPHYITIGTRKHTMYYKGKGFYCKACKIIQPHDHYQNCKNKEKYEAELEEERERLYEQQNDFRGPLPVLGSETFAAKEKDIGNLNMWQNVINGKRERTETNHIEQNVIGLVEEITKEPELKKVNMENEEYPTISETIITTKELEKITLAEEVRRKHLQYQSSHIKQQQETDMGINK